MTVGVAIFVALGILAALLLGIGMGFDRGAYVILGFIIMVGLLAVAATRKAQMGSARPRTCPHCGGLISPKAPHCKHCGDLVEPLP